MTKEKCNIKQTKYLFNSLCFLPVSVNVRECRRGKQNGQSRETGKREYTRRRKTKQKHSTICVGHHYAQTNKTYTILQTT